MMVLGGRVFGGNMYGQWPGLDRNAVQLFDNADLQVTTDFRRVLSEILIRRLGNPNLGFVFPGQCGLHAPGIRRRHGPPPELRGAGPDRR
jgi:hypothetical protein